MKIKFYKISKKSLLTSLLMICALLTTFIPYDVSATNNIDEQTYKIIYRSGGVGVFSESYMEKINEFVDNDTIVSAELSESKIVLTVRENTPYSSLQIPTATDMVGYDTTTHFAYGGSDKILSNNGNVTWGPDVNESVTRSDDYVVQYGTLVDSVSYTIMYKNDTAVEIALMETALSNDGQIISRAAKTIEGYNLVSKNQMEITLDKEKPDNNIIVFEYIRDEEIVHVIREEIIDGGVINLTEDVNIINPGDDTIDDNEVPLTDDTETEIDDNEIPTTSTGLLSSTKTIILFMLILLLLVASILQISKTIRLRHK